MEMSAAIRVCCWCLLASGATGLALPTRALAARTVRSGAAAHSLLRAPAVARRHAAVVAQEAKEEAKDNKLFFLDIETKGGIVFWSIVGIGAPFFVYNFLQDNMGMDVVRLPAALDPSACRASASTHSPPTIDPAV